MLKDERLRFFLVIIWVGFLSIYSFIHNSSEFYNDILSDDHLQTESWAFANVSDRYHVAFAKRITDENISPPRIHIQEIKSVHGEIILDNSFFENTSTKGGAENTSAKKDVEYLNKLHAFLNDVKTDARYFNFNPKSAALPNKQKIRNVYDILSLGLPILLGLMFLYFLAVLKWEDKCAPHLSYVTVFCIFLVGIAHSILIWVQGGILVSPIGSITGAVITILVSHFIVVYTRRQILRSIFWGTPVLVFSLGAWLGHKQANLLYDESTKLLLQHKFEGWYLGVFLGALLLGAATLRSRKGHEIHPEASGQGSTIANQPAAGS
jgi:hypothetical protein